MDFGIFLHIFNLLLVILCSLLITHKYQNSNFI
nr:MAG TPA: hypothetical protein [Caudoviricetes sp.]